MASCSWCGCGCRRRCRSCPCWRSGSAARNLPSWCRACWIASWRLGPAQHCRSCRPHGCHRGRCRRGRRRGCRRPSGSPAGCLRGRRPARPRFACTCKRIKLFLSTYKQSCTRFPFLYVLKKINRNQTKLKEELPFFFFFLGTGVSQQFSPLPPIVSFPSFQFACLEFTNKRIGNSFW